MATTARKHIQASQGVAGAQAFEPYFAAFPGVWTRNWQNVKQSRQTSVHVDAGIINSDLTHGATVSDQIDPFNLNNCGLLAWNLFIISLPI